ncbi:MAG: type II 3-dehydroquinate dehydratase [Clostridia bacterium]|nr:type II 3-dehydroquinate dehydratase [Clostridia bacterium]
MKILVINGVNLNMVGIREPELYGKSDFKALVNTVKGEGKRLGIKVTHYQSNSEGDICTKIQKAYDKYDGIVINAGAYTHTSIAILDALKAVGIPTVEVHLTDIYTREEFRHKSYISLYAEKVIAGKGFDGYKEALKYFIDKGAC